MAHNLHILCAGWNSSNASGETGNLQGRVINILVNFIFD